MVRLKTPPFTFKMADSGSRRGLTASRGDVLPTEHDDQRFVETVQRWIETHTSFESSTPIASAMTEIKSAKTLNDVFVIPLQRQLLGLDSALKFMLFLSLGAPKILEESDTPDIKAEFSVTTAFETITQVFDLGINEIVWDFVHSGGDGDSDDESE